MGGKLGFTLIELLLSMAIVAILVSLAIPYFRDFRANQELLQGAQELETNLRFVQSQAYGGVKHASCEEDDELIGRFINFEPIDGAPWVMNIYTRCGDKPPILVKELNLPEGVTLLTNPPGVDVLFQPINKKAVFIADAGSATPESFDSSPESMTISLRNAAGTIPITVLATGDISLGPRE